MPSEVVSSRDAELLARFARTGDGGAFAELVRRHGPLAHGVCTRVLAGRVEADDAYQAVLIVLARKAGGVRDPGRLAPWIYGVAVRCAMRARRSLHARHRRESPLFDLPARAADDDWAEVGPVLDAEVDRLPEKLRAALVLCELQGVTRAEAARRLGVPEGTLSSRLARAKETLRLRLVRRGVTLTSAALAATLAKAQVSSAGGPAAGTLSAAAIALAQAEVIMFGNLGAVKVLLGLLTALGLTLAGIGLVPPAKPGKPDAAAEKAKLKGEWRVDRYVHFVELEGKVLDAGTARGVQKLDNVVFDGTSVTLPGSAASTYEPSGAGTPLQIDFDPNRGVERMFGVYKLAEEPTPTGTQTRLTISVATGSREFPAENYRPKDFECKPGGGTVLLELIRVDDLVAAEKAKLAGKWVCKSEQTITTTDWNGKRRSWYDDLEMTFTVDTLVQTPGVHGEEYVIRPDESPKEIDVTATNFNTVGVARTQLGVYELAGDTLRLHFALPGNPRPASFVPVQGQTKLLMLTRPTVADADARLRGEWRVVEQQVGGKPVAATDERAVRTCVFEGGAIQFVTAGGQAKSHYRLDVRAQLNRIDLFVDRAPDAASTPGIYRLNGPFLTLKFGGDLTPYGQKVAKRPTKIESDEADGAKTTRYVLSRVDAESAERAALTGSWDIESVRYDGDPNGGKLVFGSARIVIDGERVRGLLGARSPAYAARYTTEVSRSPHLIDLEPRQSQGLGVDPAARSIWNTPSHGIYKIEGDTLTWHFAAPDAKGYTSSRPTDFTPAKPGARHVLAVLKRVKAPAAPPTGGVAGVGVAAAPRPPQSRPAFAPGALLGSVRIDGRPATGGRVTVSIGNGRFVGGLIANGQYATAPVPPGTYRVTAELQAGTTIETLSRTMTFDGLETEWSIDAKTK